jgi:hypothetical protein
VTPVKSGEATLSASPQLAPRATAEAHGQGNRPEVLWTSASVPGGADKKFWTP